MHEVTRITDRWGGRHYVRAADLARPDKMLVRYTDKHGVYLRDRVSPRTGLLVRMSPGAKTMIHRENIVEGAAHA